MNLGTIPNAAAHVLCKAKLRRGKPDGTYLIERTLGYKTWATKGEKGRHDIAPLYKAGLVSEWFHPWAPPLYLTDKGISARRILRKRLGYD